MNAVQQLSERSVPVSRACDVLGLARSSFYRAQQAQPPRKPRPKPERALSQEEQEYVLDVLNSECF